LATEQGTSIGRTITLLMIFAITIVAIIIIFAYFNGLFKFVTEGAGSASVTGVFALSGAGSTSGNLILQVTDTSGLPITGIQVTCPTAQFATGICAGLQMNYQASPVSSANPLSKGDFASGSQDVQSAPGTNFTAGTIYTITVTFTFGDGTMQSQTVSVAAQA